MTEGRDLIKVDIRAKIAVGMASARAGKLRDGETAMAELMQQEARPDEDFLRRKVEKARASIAAGKGVSGNDVEAMMAEKRRHITADKA